MMIKHHLLKTKSKYFWDVVCGFKNFEIRKNDRDFKPGDILNLAEIKDTLPVEFTGFVVQVEVIYLFEGYGLEYGLDVGFCIMGIKLIPSNTLSSLRFYKENTASMMIATMDKF